MANQRIEKYKQYPKRIPYGMMNFKAVVEDDCYYSGQDIGQDHPST